jgi:hypothetical protein
VPSKFAVLQHNYPLRQMEDSQSRTAADLSAPNGDGGRMARKCPNRRGRHPLAPC